jgi:uncharacterized damage-inducible protein DinB
MGRVTPAIRWFDRRFEFALPHEAHEVVVERLRGLVPRLAHKLANVAPATLTRRVDDTWSVQENVGHLLDLEPLWHARLDELLAGAPRLRAADLANRRTHEAAWNDVPLPGIVDRLRQSRDRFVERLDGLAAADFARVSRHPRLDQPMRLVDHALFVAEHDDHHLARITELLRLP